MERENGGLCFPEPSESDPTYANPIESTLRWLSRSTHSLAVDMRRFLNFNLSQLQNDFANELHGRLLRDGEHWTSAFFEMIVARSLQSLGAVLEIAPEVNGSKPDFLARFGKKALIVEATAPIFHAETQAQMGKQNHLKAIVGSLVPVGWAALLHRLPDLGPADSKREFKRVLRRSLEDQGPPTEKGEHREARVAVGSQYVELTLIAMEDPKIKIAGGPGFGFYGNGVEKIRKTVRKKRPQVRDANCPVILAVNASEIFSKIGDFDKALLGHQRRVYDVESEKVTEDRFVADGVFDPVGDELPTFAGVLAYIEAGFFCSREPVLYVHPRFGGSFPEPFQRLETRSYDPGVGIIKTEARGEPVLAALNPVDRSLL